MAADDGRSADRGDPSDGSPHGTARERRRGSARDIYETILAEGEEQLERPVGSLLWSGLAAGLAMGFSLAVEALLRAHLPEAGWSHLVSNFGYTVGFLIVVLGQQQLFTEDTLTVVLPVIEQKRSAVFGRMLRLWAAVLAANVIGALIYAAVASGTELFSREVRQAMGEIGQHAAEPGAWVTFLRAIMAGWLIALMVWLLPEAGPASPFIIVAITYVVAIAELAHVIAGSTEVGFAAFAGLLSWEAAALGFFLPALVGNILGGVALVALLNHAQVEHDPSGRRYPDDRA